MTINLRAYTFGLDYECSPLISRLSSELPSLLLHYGTLSVAQIRCPFFQQLKLEGRGHGHDKSYG